MNPVKLVRLIGMWSVLLSLGPVEMQEEDSGTFKLMCSAKELFWEKKWYLKHLFFMCILSSITQGMQ